jgi:hypothetical protein
MPAAWRVSLGKAKHGGVLLNMARYPTLNPYFRTALAVRKTSRAYPTSPWGIMNKPSVKSTAIAGAALIVGIVVGGLAFGPHRKDLRHPLGKPEGTAVQDG